MNKKISGIFAVLALLIYGITDLPDLELPNAQSDYNIIKYGY
jgi:hypothetical protein